MRKRMSTTRSHKLERDLQREVIDWCKESGLYYINIHGGGFTGRGTPDIIICLDGRFVAVELKVGKNKLEPAQVIRRNQILQSNGVHIAPRSFSEFLEEIKNIWSK